MGFEVGRLRMHLLESGTTDIRNQIFPSEAGLIRENAESADQPFILAGVWNTDYLACGTDLYRM